MALGDVTHATREIPRVGEPDVAPALRRIAERLRSQDGGPFLVVLGSGTRPQYHQGFDNKAIRFEIAQRGIAVAENVILVPIFQRQRTVIGTELRVRYRILPLADYLALTGNFREGWELIAVEDG